VYTFRDTWKNTTYFQSIRLFGNKAESAAASPQGYCGSKNSNPLVMDSGSQNKPSEQYIICLPYYQDYNTIMQRAHDCSRLSLSIQLFYAKKKVDWVGFEQLNSSPSDGF
jgi:hypothetical protein